MADEVVRTAVDDLLDAFIVTMTPNHHASLGAPSVAIEVRKSDLREAASALLSSYAAYLDASRTTLTASSHAGGSDPESAKTSSTPTRSKK